MDESTAAQWLHLLNTPGLGPVRTRALLDHYSDINEVFQEQRFPEQLNIPTAAAHNLRQATNDQIKQELDWLQKPSNHLLTWHDPLYPPQLRLIADPPMVLFVKGDLNSLLLPQLAVVGSRNATRSGLNNAKAFSAELSRKGLVITSGLAAGIDAAAHQGALDSGGLTIAVMGTGINTIYPKGNQSLAKTIIQQGAVVSELPFNMPPHAGNFPRRNRIIAGLSLGTLVVEAARKSGTAITARLSMECNRPVMAIPGSIHNPMARGCHQLIRQGASLVESAQDILEELQPHIHMLSDQLSNHLKEIDQQSIEKPAPEPHMELSDTQQLIFQQIDYHPVSFDDIVKHTELSSAVIASDLLIMELSGLIEKLPGATYQRT
ncbi:DNA-processing protein DprA [Marinicella sediminis]|uniref:DNA-processing protein DprA n=1 Tax=Marinicella sediminis TaxID=1792834 RepID=A0ABV7JE19_9GAMM|nr:DNA-processing protein DprA [Marinicella sediminis]